MTDRDLADHLEHISGEHFAHMLILSALLKANPAVADQLRRYRVHMETEQVFDDWSDIKLQAMKRAVDQALPRA